MVWHTTPKLVHSLFPDRLWGKSSEDTIYLTFDDGPVPGVTDFVLNELAKRNQKATFFVVGDNVKRHPELAKEVLASGHQLGNHTYNHLNGWKTKKEEYVRNIEKCDKVLVELGVEKKLFRPPYGMISSSQAKVVSKNHQIVMWNMLTGDYDKNLDAKKILRSSIRYSIPGSIVVWHDQQKTKDILPQILPHYLDFIQQKGWKTGLL